MGNASLGNADGAGGGDDARGHRRRVLETAAALSEARRRKDDGPLGPKAARTRRSLLETATNLFVRDGYRNTSVERIHLDAGVGLGTFYQYFEGKADLMAALVGEAILASADHVFPRLDTARGPGASPRVAVERFVVHYARTVTFQRVWEEATHVEPLIAEFRREVTAAIVADLADHISHRQEQGTVPKDLAPVPTSMALTACVDRYCYLTFVDARRRGQAAIVETVDVLSKVWQLVLASGAQVA